MSSIQLSLTHLFQEAFGIKAKPFEPKFPPVRGFDQKSRMEKSLMGAPMYAHNDQGTLHYMPVYLWTNDKAEGVNFKVMLPYAVVAISAQKRIVETTLVEQGGTLKELIGLEDYVISIKGLMVGKDNVFPEADIADLRNLYEWNRPISMQCALTDIFLLRPHRSGSEKVVIKDLKWPFIKGYPSVRPYELTLLSDHPFQLKMAV